MSESSNLKRAAADSVTARALRLPEMGPPRRRVPELAPQVEVTISPPGSIPVSVVVPASGSTPEALDALARSARDLPRLATGAGRGAVDIRLESATGSHVKTGRLILTQRGGRPVSVPIDPASRRFRVGDLPAGDYEVRAAAAEYGRATSQITVRDSDVVRQAIRLDGAAVKGSTRLQFAIDGIAGPRVRVRATSRTTGKIVFDKMVAVRKGIATAVAVPSGSLHFEFIDGDERSCYDADVTDLAAMTGPHHLAITPSWKLPVPTPDPPEWLVLPEELDGVARTLSRLGLGSMEELAAAQPETLMHRLLEGPKLPVGTRLLCAAIEAARRQIGLDPTIGETATRLRLAHGKSSTRTFRVAEPGTVDLDIDLGPGAKGRVEIEGPGRGRRVQFSGRRELSISMSAKDVAAGKTLRVKVVNQSGRSATGRFVARLPGTPGFATIPQRSVRERIEAILAALGVVNPGLSPTVSPDVLAPENIRGWLDRGHAIMRQLGVCSISDLGVLRIEPSQKLEAGAYVAPALPPSPGSITTLANYKLASVIGGTVLHYRPNDILHQWAVVLAGAWDLRGQVLFIGKEIRELYVIVGQLLHDAGTFILWEQPELPEAPDYWPEAAANGGFVQSWGADGENGADGDPNPPRSKNGGVSATLDGPTVTMYLLDSANGLPPILLGGQKGGAGGAGQNGGNGGNGFEGRPADGTFFGGCCRGAGWGGNGGAAGNGGKGGTGGRGGEGGRITILTTAAGITAMETDPPFITCRSGRGGPGGPGGQAGSPGLGGPPGSAECQPHCDEHPERQGDAGALGVRGPEGDQGRDGPLVPSDAIQILPITQQEWNEAFSNPHITHIAPTAAESGDVVALFGLNFDPQVDHVFFDGSDRGPVLYATLATFVVPSDQLGGFHPVVIRPVAASSRLSNQVQLDVMPQLDPLPPLTRWEEGETISVHGNGFMSGSHLIAEDWSTDPVTQFNLQLAGTPVATIMQVQIPAAPLGNVRGVRRLKVRNPTGSVSKGEVVVRIGHEIVVRCAAFRLVGETSGDTTPYSTAQIASLFVEGAFNALTQIWNQASIAFKLVAPVKDVLIDDFTAFCFPHLDAEEEAAAEAEAHAAAPFVPGAINIFFVRDVEDAISFGEFGGGPVIVGAEGGDGYDPYHFMENVAHEIGHALCLSHVCDEEGDYGLPVCLGSHTTSLMYPVLISSSSGLSPSEIEIARRSATHFEQGKTAALPLSALNQPVLPAQCLVGDTEN